MFNGYYLIRIFVLVKMYLLVNGGFPPWMISEFDAEYYLSMSRPIPFVIKCSAMNGEVRYQWYKNNIKVQKDNHVLYSELSGEITFLNLTKEDFGMYHCRAQNYYGFSVSLYFKLIEAGLGVFSERKNETKTCATNHYCKLTCQATPYCEPKNDCMTEWITGTGTANYVKSNRNIMIDPDGNLHFLSVSKFDDGKQFKCGVWNEKIQTFKMSRSITTINVTETSEKAIMCRPVYKRDFKALAGETVTLACIFGGNPIPNITWYDTKGHLITPNSKYSIGKYTRELIIRNVTFDDEGEFKCTSETYLTNNPFLNVTSPPIFPGVGRRFLVKTVQKSNKEEIVLRCNASSAPDELNPVVISWMRNGKDIFKDSSYLFSDENTVLHILQEKVNERGSCYTCVTENSEGIAVANFLISSWSDEQNAEILPLTTVILSIMILFLLVTGAMIIKRILTKSALKTNSGQIRMHKDNITNANVGEHEYMDPEEDISDHVYEEPDNE